MKNLKKNSKGFTLIELLAVIVILGVLMIIAVPMVSQYITSSRQNAFVSTAKAYVSSARYMYLNDDLDCSTTSIDAAGTSNGTKIMVLFSDIKIDKGSQCSFGSEIDMNRSYVEIEYDDATGGYNYYVQMVDKAKNGWSSEIPESELDKSDVLLKRANPKWCYQAPSTDKSCGYSEVYSAGSSLSLNGGGTAILCVAR